MFRAYSCGKICWGPRWRGWWSEFYYQGEIHLETGFLRLRCFSKNRRHPGIFQVKISATEMSSILNIDTELSSFTWRRIMEVVEDASVTEEAGGELKDMWLKLVASLRLVNTTEGSKILFAGDEINFQLVQWPEEREQFRFESRSCVKIQKRWRGVKGRARHAKLKVTWKSEVEKRRKLKIVVFEKKRRSSAAVTLQASVKRGLGRKRAKAMQEIREHGERDAERERAEKERMFREMVKVQKIVRGE